MPIRQDDNQPNRRFGIINIILIGVGALLLFLFDPFGLSEPGYFFLIFGPFCFMLWFKALLPFYIAQLKGHQMTGCQNFALGCLSFVLLVAGSICLFFVVLTMYN